MTQETPPTQGPGRHPGFESGREVWLLRHAQVHESWRGKAYGGLDVPLSEQGEERSRRIVRDFGELPFAALCCSPLARARVLGEGIAGRSGARLTTDEGLREIDRGRWAGRVIEELHREASEEIEAFFADPWNFDGHGGETDADVWRRAWPALERVVRETDRPGPVAIVSHYNVTRILLAHALGIDPITSYRLRIDTGAAALLRDGPGGWVLLRSNVLSPRTAGHAGTRA